MDWIIIQMLNRNTFVGYGETNQSDSTIQVGMRRGDYNGTNPNAIFANMRQTGKKLMAQLDTPLEGAAASKNIKLEWNKTHNIKADTSAIRQL